eukprot:95900_1
MYDTHNLNVYTIINIYFNKCNQNVNKCINYINRHINKYQQTKTEPQQEIVDDKSKQLAAKYFNEAVLIATTTNFGDAIDTFKMAYRLYPGCQLHINAQFGLQLRANIHTILADQYRDDGKLEQAAKEHRNAQKLIPRSYVYYLNETNILAAQGEYDAAIDVCKKAIAVYEQNEDSIGDDQCFLDRFYSKLHYSIDVVKLKQIQSFICDQQYDSDALKSDFNDNNIRINQSNLTKYMKQHDLGIYIDLVKQKYDKTENTESSSSTQNDLNHALQVIYQMMGEIEWDRKAYKQALVYYDKALSEQFDPILADDIYKLDLMINKNVLEYGKNAKVNTKSDLKNSIYSGVVHEKAANDAKSVERFGILNNEIFYTCEMNDFNKTITFYDINKIADVITLDKIQAVRSVMGNEADKFPFEIHFIFKNNDVMIYCLPSQNIRDEWVTHIQQFLNNDPSYNNNNQHEFKTDKSTHNATECKSVEACNAFLRLTNINSVHTKWNNIVAKAFINLQQILNDYHHCLIEHNTSHDFDCFTQMSKCECDDIVSCSSFIRSRWGINSENEVYKDFKHDYERLSVEIFDSLHNYLYHSKISSISKRRQIVEEIENHAKSSAKMKINADISSKFTTTVKSDSKLYEFAFGEYMEYWNSEVGNYIYPKYNNLKAELLQNPICSLQISKWNILYLKATILIKCDQAKKLHAIESDRWNKYVHLWSPITLNHIIVLCSYANHTDVQCKFKKQCRKVSSDETLESLWNRNSSVANWCRYLWESVRLYGSDATNEDTFYHGISCKLLMNQFCAYFKSPLSCTTSIVVAQVFAAHDGIILQLKKGAGNAMYFDMRWVSDFNEKETLFFNSSLNINSIILNELENPEVTNLKPWIKTLLIFESILNGTFFVHTINVENMSSLHDNMILLMQHIMENNAYDKIKSGHDNQCDQNLIKYVLQLFDNQIKNIDGIWLHKTELKKFISKQLQRYLYDFDRNIPGNFIHCISNKYQYDTLQFVDEFNWKIDLKKLRNEYKDEHCMRSKIMEVNVRNKSEIFTVSIQFGCYKECRDVENVKWLQFGIILVSLPHQFQSLTIDYEVLLKQMNINHTFGDHTFSRNEIGSIYGGQLIPWEMCNNLPSLTCEVCVKIEYP